MITRLLALLSIAAAAGAQTPVADIRNTETPNTDTHFQAPRYAHLAEWKARRLELRQQILAAAGLDPMPERGPLNPQVFGKLDRAGYSIEKVLLETLPHYYLGGNLYRPDKPGRHPAVLVTHGHWTYGRLENTKNFSGPVLCVNLARQGYVVLAIDMVGVNDTLQTPHEFGGAGEDLWRFGPLGLQLWNASRALDYLLSRDDVDGARIGMTGASGGGSQTFLLTAVDDRIAASAPVNMVSAYMQGGARCENAPGLRIGTSNVEIAAMAAPRPLLLVSDTGDWTANVPHEELPAIRGIYTLFDQPEAVENFHQDAEHNFNRNARESVYRFFAKVLLHDADWKNYSERGVDVERLQDLLALMGRELPQGAVDYDGLFAEWKAMAGQQVASADAATLRARLARSIGVAWPMHVEYHDQAGAMFLSRAGAGERIPLRVIHNSGAPVLVIHPDGIAAASALPEIQTWSQKGNAVAMIDAFQTGAARAPRDRSAEHFLGFNLTDDANRVQDILTTLAFIHENHGGPASESVQLHCAGPAANWCVVAAAIAPIKVSLDPVPDLPADDQYLVDHFFVPGLERQGGMAAARRLALSNR
jgi:dienelactone hydrolase